MGPRTLTRSLVEATVVAVAGGALALGINLLRPDGLPLIAPTPYQTLVPCPEPGGPVTPLEADDPALSSSRSFIIDARGPGAFEGEHLDGARNVPYDWLDPIPEESLHELARAIAASRATRVVVYGDGGRPDSGEHLGKEISGRGIKNVCFVLGGAAAVLGEEDR